MELEHRVKILEQEVKILKNQIQATLLDIQAHALNEEYPILRAESAAQQTTPQPVQPQPEPYVAVPEAAHDEDEQIGSAPVIRKVSFKDMEEEDTFAEPVLALDETEFSEMEPVDPVVYADMEPVAPVAYADVKPVTPVAYAAEEVAAPQPPSQPGHIDWATFTLLANWVSNSIEQMGVARTEKLVKVYATKELMSPDLTSALLEFISLHDEDGSLAQPGVENTIQRISDGLGTLPGDEAYHQENDHTREMILRLITGIQNIGLEEQHNG